MVTTVRGTVRHRILINDRRQPPSQVADFLPPPIDGH